MVLLVQVWPPDRSNQWVPSSEPSRFTVQPLGEPVTRIWRVCWLNPYGSGRAAVVPVAVMADHLNVTGEYCATATAASRRIRSSRFIGPPVEVVQGSGWAPRSDQPAAAARFPAWQDHARRHAPPAWRPGRRRFGPFRS